ncbi:hypothetical protein [Siphonobacter aquaeclarae]|uniref:Uncharacterized protein n=1 Tax=Siphonobacter aquaeclarae TaxID=563176 RepID=A0A1G9W9K5_9BACT|nr:hypothetical protein [Siphonobacter aquaeclarae]SDM81244.1 hypothetical protein SAMN04488090_4301 [Siphonobacter aquaeclarae]
MSNYIIKSFTRGFEVYRENETAPVTTFQYNGWFSSDGRAETGNNTVEIKAKNVWASKFDVFIDGIDKGDILFNWKGEIIIRLDTDGVEKSYRLKSRGLWNMHFELEDEQEQRLLLLQPAFKWDRLNYEYQVSGEQEPSILLILTSIYGINLYMTMMAVV